MSADFLNEKLLVEIDLRSVTVNGVRFSEPFARARFDDILGLEPRVYEGLLPAPAGHRNNWRHVYDQIGIGLLDQHDTQLIESIEVYLHIPDKRKAHQPLHPFSGELRILGVPTDEKTTAQEIMAASPYPFRQNLPGEWSCRRPGVFLDLVVSSHPPRRFCERTEIIRSISFDFVVHSPA